MTLNQPSPNFANRSSTLIHNYLDGTTDSGAKSTADEITALARETSSLEQTDSQFSLEAFLWGLWAEIRAVIIEIPHNHPWQDTMVELLAAIKTVPRSVTPEMEALEREWGMAFWQDLPIFGADFRESWDQGPGEEIPDVVYGDGGNVPYSPDTWASLNAFTARVTAASVSNFESYGMWIFRHTLEQERITEEVDDNLPAAAMWIVYAGETVYHNNAARDYSDLPATYHPPDVRYLCQFNEPFSLERWGFWKERFGFLKDHEVLKQSTRDSAGEALGRMVEIERCHPEPTASEEPALRPSGLMTAMVEVRRRFGRS